MHQDNMIKASANLNHLFYEDAINDQNKKEIYSISTKERDYGKKKARKKSSTPLEHPMITRTKKKGHDRVVLILMTKFII
uniref:Transposase n=1 Tax=Strongyloides venezuelensis TaxID=75913 RepID=A0A0K0FJR6_STRVS